MKANIISLTSLPGGMKDVQFQLKDCYSFIFLCFEQFPVQSHVLLQLPAEGSAGVCQTPGSCGVRKGDPCRGCAGWGEGVLGEGCAEQVLPGSCRHCPRLSLPVVQPRGQRCRLGTWGVMGGRGSGRFPQEEVAEETEGVITPSSCRRPAPVVLLELRLEPRGTPWSSSILPNTLRKAPGIDNPRPFLLHLK